MIGQKLKTIRKTRGFTQEKLAKEVGLSTITIKGYESNKFSPSLETLTKIAEKRACKKKGGELDLEKMSSFVVDDFRGGRIGKITLERPEDFETPAVTAETKKEEN